MRSVSCRLACCRLCVMLRTIGSCSATRGPPACQRGRQLHDSHTRLEDRINAAMRSCANGMGRLLAASAPSRTVGAPTSPTLQGRSSRTSAASRTSCTKIALGTTPEWLLGAVAWRHQIAVDCNRAILSLADVVVRKRRRRGRRTQQQVVVGKKGGPPLTHHRTLVIQVRPVSVRAAASMTCTRALASASTVACSWSVSSVS